MARRRRSARRVGLLRDHTRAHGAAQPAAELAELAPSALNVAESGKENAAPVAAAAVLRASQEALAVSGS